MNKLKSFVKSLLASEGVKRVFHTFWQAAGGVLVAQLFAAHSAHDVYAAVVIAVAAGLAALKAAYVARKS